MIGCVAPEAESTRAAATATAAQAAEPPTRRCSPAPVTLCAATLQHVLSFCSDVPLAVAACTPGLRRIAERHRGGLAVAGNVYHERMGSAGAGRHGAAQPVLVCQICDDAAVGLARWWLRQGGRGDAPCASTAHSIAATAQSVGRGARAAPPPAREDGTWAAEREEAGHVGGAARWLQIHRDGGHGSNTIITTTMNDEKGGEKDRTPLCSPTTSEGGRTTASAAQENAAGERCSVCALSLADHVGLSLGVDEMVLKHVTLCPSRATGGEAALHEACGLRVLRLHCVTLPTSDLRRLLAANAFTLRCLELTEMPLALPARLPLAACAQLRELALLRPTLSLPHYESEEDDDDDDDDDHTRSNNKSNNHAAGGGDGERDLGEAAAPAELSAVPQPVPPPSSAPPRGTAGQMVQEPHTPRPAPPPRAAEAASFIAAIASLPQLISLDLTGWPAALELSALARCPALRGLNLNASAVTSANVEQVSRAGSLRSLLLAHTAVSSVQALRHCRFLHTLHLAHTAITTAGLAGLEQLAHLVQLDLSHTAVTEVGGLADCPRLSALNLYGSAVTSAGLAGLERAPRLRHLFLGHTAVHSVSLLGRSVSLEQVMLPMTEVDTDGVLGLERIPSLRTLSLAHTRVDDVRALRVCRRLQVLDLSHSAVTSAGIAGLEQIPSLTTLLLSHSEVDSIRVLAASRSLQEIQLQRAKVTDGSAALAGIGDLPRLRTLSVTECALCSLDALGSCAALRRLNLWCTHVNSASLAALAGAQRLRQLDLADSDVTEIGPLLACGRLVSLTLCNTRVRAVDGLERLRYLRKLNLAATEVHTVACLRRCPALRTLVLSHTPVDDAGLRGVEQIATLRTVLLQGTRVSQIGRLGRGAQLQVLVARHCPIDAAGLVGLEHAVGLVRLDLSYTHLREGVLRLAGCQRLRKLNLVFTDVPLAELVELSAALPRCHVVHDAVERMRKRVTLLPPSDT